MLDHSFDGISPPVIDLVPAGRHSDGLGVCCETRPLFVDLGSAGRLLESGRRITADNFPAVGGRTAERTPDESPHLLRRLFTLTFTASHSHLVFFSTRFDSRLLKFRLLSSSTSISHQHPPPPCDLSQALASSAFYNKKDECREPCYVIGQMPQRPITAALGADRPGCEGSESCSFDTQ